MTRGILENALKLAAYKPQAAQVTYNFYTKLPGFYKNLKVPFSNVKEEFPLYQSVFDSPGLTGSERAIFANSTKLFEQVSGLKFIKVADDTPSDIAVGALRFDPARESAWTSRGSQSLSAVDAGDIWLGSVARLGQPQLPEHKNFFYLVVPHEISHALGLAHPADVGLRGIEDSMQYTIMSYRQHPDHPADVYALQLYDVAALQWLYGSSASNPGSTIYNLFKEAESGTGKLTARYFTICDSGGAEDVIDARQQSSAVYIDLRPGYFSSIGSATSEPKSLVRVSNGEVFQTGFGNISIAFGTFIENAAGTSQNDVIVGNDFANRIQGGGGHDLIFTSGSAIKDALKQDPKLGIKDWSGGDYRIIDRQKITNVSLPDKTKVVDILDGGAGDDFLYGGWGRDRLIGGDGKDTIHGGQSNDTIIGGKGVDVVYGEAGSDRFEFRALSDAGDRIMDFHSAITTPELVERDVIVIASSAFGGRKLADVQIINSAKDPAPVELNRETVLYEAGTGKVFYDKDGTGSSAAVLICTIHDPPFLLQHGDILLA